MQHKSWRLQTGVNLGVCLLSVEAKSCFSAAFPLGVGCTLIFCLFYMSSFNYILDNDEEKCNLVMRVNLRRLRGTLSIS